MGLHSYAVIVLHVILSLLCNSVSGTAGLQIPVRRSSRFRHKSHRWASRMVRAPTHAFTLPQACRKPPCQERAVAELRRAGCLDVLLFKFLLIVKATCPSQAVLALRNSRRFVDIAQDQRMHIAAPTLKRGNVTSTAIVDITHNSTHRQEATRESTEPPSQNNAFERTATLHFSRQLLDNGESADIGHAVNGNGETFWLSGPRRAAACSHTRGEGVTVYVIDTGCRISHEELSGRAVALAAPGSPFQSGADDHGHGTHVAATIAGRRFGLAGRARVVCIKALSERNEGSSTDVIAGIQLAVSMHRRARRDGSVPLGVVSISLGVRASPLYRALDRALEQARRHGLVGVVAAGNAGGDACRFTPARSRAAVTVAAVGKDGRLARFSNRGRCVTVAAPGVHVWSATKEADDRYARSSGTSMAAPYVSALAALVIAGEPWLRVAQVVRMLQWVGRETDKGRRRKEVPVVSVDGYCRLAQVRKLAGDWI